MPASNRRIRLKDIAGELGISTATVSLCLNGGYERYQVNSETVSKVRDYARQVGYTPNRSARNLRTGDRRCVGLLTNHHWRAGQKCLPAVFAAEQLLAAQGIETRQVSARSQVEGLRQLRELGCDDAIVFDPVIEKSEFLHPTLTADDFEQYFPGMTVYAVDYSMPVPPAEFRVPRMSRMGVAVGDFQERLARLMMEFYPGEMMMYLWRCSQQAVNRLLADTPELVFRFTNENPFKLGIDGAHQYLELRKTRRISTVFWGDDRMACGFVNELLRCGVNVPDELNVVSFDNLEFSQYLAIPLTTWGVPIVRHTKLAVEAILHGGEPLEIVSKPVLSCGRSARLVPEMLEKLREWCDFSETFDDGNE